MRILIACQTYAHSRNGPAVFTRRLAESLAGLGHAVCVVAPASGPHSERAVEAAVELEGIRALPLSRSANVFVTFLERPALRRVFDAFSPDVVHVQDHYPLCAAVIREARLRGVPLIASNYFTPLAMTRQVRALSFRAFERFLWWTVVRTFDEAQVVTTPTPTAVALLAGQGLRAPLRAISCGVDLASFHPAPVDRAAVRERFGLSPSRRLLLYLGRVERDKSLDVLVEAVRLLGRADVQLGIIGTGVDLERMRKVAAPLGEAVAFAGFVESADLPDLLRSADLFGMPSANELQSIASLEAMSVGLPVLAANAGALPELVSDEINGRLFRPGDARDAADAIEWLLAHAADWSRMGEESLRRAREHDWRLVLERYVALYEEVAGAPSTTSPEARAP